MIKVCEVEGCNITEEETYVFYSNELEMDICNKHFARYKNNGHFKTLKELEGIKKCQICGKTENETRVLSKRNKFGMELCGRHYQQIAKHGEVSERTIFDPNPIIKYETYAEIVMFDKHQNENARTKINLEDIGLVKKYKWHLKGNGYPVAHPVEDNCQKCEIRLNRLIMGVELAPTEVYVDHKDRNKLNNLRENLRICNNSQNQMNKKIPENNKLGYKGVGFHEASGKWRARIFKEGKEYYLGIFENKKDAIRARLKAEKELFGEFAYNKELKESG